MNENTKGQREITSYSNLMLAAPGLLEALKAMRSRWGKNRWCSDPECTVCAEEISITNAADSAIAKAEGK